MQTCSSLDVSQDEEDLYILNKIYDSLIFQYNINSFYFIL